MGGDDGHCVPRSACGEVSYRCARPSLELRLLTSAADRPGGHAALAAPGDILLGNDRFVAIIDAPDTPHYLAPSGGSVLDLVPRDGTSDDDLDQIFQAAGILPDDAVHYDSFELLDEIPNRVSVVLRGRLDGRDIDVVTRYEARPCEPGLRVRTELYHDGRDPLSVLLSDAFFWGDRGPLPFAPLEGHGFDHGELDLEELGDSLVDTPWVAAPTHASRSTTIANVACQEPTHSGFLDETLTAMGRGPLIVMPGDSIALERMLLAAPGPGMQGAADSALELRDRLFHEEFVTVEGRVRASDGNAIHGGNVSLLIYEPAPEPHP